MENFSDLLPGIVGTSFGLYFSWKYVDSVHRAFLPDNPNEEPHAFTHSAELIRALFLVVPPVLGLLVGMTLQRIAQQ